MRIQSTDPVRADAVDQLVHAHRLNPDNNDILEQLHELLKNLVHSIVQRRFGRQQDDPLYDDLVSEGVIAIFEYLPRFDESRGNHFSTYIYWWVIQRIERWLKDNGYTIRMPVCRRTTGEKYFKAVGLYVRCYGEPPETDADLADFLGCSVEQVVFIKTTCTDQGVSSLDAELREDGDPLIDFIPDPKANDPLDILLRKECFGKGAEMLGRKELARLINELVPKARDRQILLEYFKEDATLESVGKTHGVTRERIRQVVKKAIVRIRRHLGVDEALPIWSPQEKPPEERQFVVEPGELGLTEFVELVRQKERSMAGEKKMVEGRLRNVGEAPHDGLPELNPSLLRSALIILARVPVGGRAELCLADLAREHKVSPTMLYPDLTKLDRLNVAKRDGESVVWGDKTKVRLRCGRATQPRSYTVLPGVEVDLGEVVDLTELVSKVAVPAPAVAGLSLTGSEPLATPVAPTAQPQDKHSGSAQGAGAASETGTALVEARSGSLVVPVFNSPALPVGLRPDMTYEEKLQAWREHEGRLGQYEQELEELLFQVQMHRAATSVRVQSLERMAKRAMEPLP